MSNPDTSFEYLMKVLADANANEPEPNSSDLQMAIRGMRPIAIMDAMRAASLPAITIKRG